ncbi:hypothetical protein JDFnp1_35 [Fusobacterium phage JD-Fnp1]|nr:hypothetical protein JDFnp1_35 [Fusobacterium phage JD-Fnp1]
MTKVQELLIEKAKGQFATAHVWTISEQGADPLSQKVMNMILDLQNDGYLGQPQVQYSSCFDTNKCVVVFSAFIMVSKK